MAQKCIKIFTKFFKRNNKFTEPAYEYMYASIYI